MTRATRYLFAPPPERLVQFGGIDAVEPDQLIGDDDCVAVDDLGAAGQAIGTPAKRQNGEETPEHSATVRCQVKWRSVGGLGLPLRVLKTVRSSLRWDMIEVRRTGTATLLEFEVVVREGHGQTRHQVTMARETSDRLTAGKHTPERCLEAAFRFLLDREPRESILSRFDVAVISRCFPEFERELPRYLAQSRSGRRGATAGAVDGVPSSMADVTRPCTDQDLDEILEVINDAAQAYKGVIPNDRFKDPYMPTEELRHEIEHGVRFWGFEQDRQLVGVMGLQDAEDVTLIRHAYVRTTHRRRGIGGRLLNDLRSQAARPLLVGTWAAAEWAIEFYRQHGFEMVPRDQVPVLLRRYWSVPERQIETSVVLAEKAWLDRG